MRDRPPANPAVGWEVACEVSGPQWMQSPSKTPPLPACWRRTPNKCPVGHCWMRDYNSLRSHAPGRTGGATGHTQGSMLLVQHRSAMPEGAHASSQCHHVTSRRRRCHRWRRSAARSARRQGTYMHWPMIDLPACSAASRPPRSEERNDLARVAAIVATHSKRPRLPSPARWLNRR